MNLGIRHHTVLSFVGLTLFFSGQVVCAQWEYGADINIGAVRSDNIFLAADGEEEAETIYVIAPRFFLRADEERIDADIQYIPQALFYSEYNDADNVFHSLDADMNLALIRDRLFLEASAVNFQSIVSPEMRVPNGNIPISGNRIDSRVWHVQPYWQQKIGSAELLLEVGYYDVSYDDESLQSSNENHARFQLGNISGQQGFAWQTVYRYRETEYDAALPWEFQQAYLSLGYWFNGTTRLFGNGGKETAFDDFLDPSMDADFWEAGLQYTPNQRLNLEFAAGDRSYGTSYRANLDYRLRSGSIRFGYSEGPGNRTETFFNRRPILDEDNLDGILDRPGQADRFVQKRGELSASIDLSKSSLFVRVFSERRENRTSDDGTSINDEEYAGIAVRWEWQMASKTTLSVGADVADRESVSFSSQILRAQAGIAYQLTERLSLRLTYSRSDQEDDDSLTEYTENQLGLFLRTSL